MLSPFRIDGPAVISFSGGRTSGYMLRRILDEGLQPDVHVVFADTGKERAETLAFVRECGQRWDVEVHWVERPHPEGVSPFEDLITERASVPGWKKRFCTVELKIEPMRQWMKARGYRRWTNVVGIRADEPSRVANLRGKREKEWDYDLPLAAEGVSERDVMAFWAAQPFDLQLRSYEGNCDCCFLKSKAKVVRIMRDRPDLAAWWIEQERRTGTPFRLDRPGYAALARVDAAQLRLFEADDDDRDAADCICTAG